MAEDYICKTTIITPFGMFEFLHLPFGLRNAWNNRSLSPTLCYYPCSLLFTTSLILASEVHEGLSLLVLFGLVCLEMSECGPGPVSSVNGARNRITLKLLCLPFLFLQDGFLMYTLTSLVLCRLVKVVLIY